MNASRQFRHLALALLGLSLAAIGLALWSSDRASHKQGPATLVVTPGGQVWVAVDDRLWRLQADGRLLHDDPHTALGLPGAPSTLNRHPQGGIVASVAGDPTLYRLDPQTARVSGRILPRWPDDLLAHGSRAINLDVHPDGRIAIATGGGHAVALFDGEGHFIARSPPGTFRFTNGLWWMGDALWTTDTNRSQLHRLDGRTLALLQTQALVDGHPARYLGPARRHPQDADRVALIRFHNGMVAGRLTALRGQTPSATPLGDVPGLQPVDLDWLGDEVLASDGGGFALWRWPADGGPPAAFGDSAVRQRLADDRHVRESGQRHWAQGLVAAGVLLVSALGLLALSRRWQARSPHAGEPVDLSQLGTPSPDRRTRWRLGWRVAWPWLLPMVPLVALRLLQASPLRPAPGSAAGYGLLAAASLLAVLLLAWAWRRHNRQALDPANEPALNALALSHLRRSTALPATLQPGETLRETFMWLCPTLRWVVLTDRRLLIFVATLADHRLERVQALRSITRATTVRPRFQGWRSLQGPGWLDLQFSDGPALRGAVPAPTVTARAAAWLHGRHDDDAVVPGRPSGPAPRAASPGRIACSLASLLVPGLGQWLQGRPRFALLLFLPWALLVTFVALPLAWALAGPRRDVSMDLVMWCAVAWAALAIVAALEAWRMSPPRP